MLSKSWLKDKHPRFVFAKVHVREKGSLRRRLIMIKTKDKIILIAKMYRLKISLKNLSMNLNIRVMIYQI